MTTDPQPGAQEGLDEAKPENPTGKGANGSAGNYKSKWYNVAKGDNSKALMNHCV